MRKKVINDLFDYGLKIYQIPGYFKFSLDSILLAEYIKVSSRTKEILDLCTGNASVPLILSTKTKANIECFEIQKVIYELGYESIKYNQLDNQIKIYNDNIININNYVSNKKYDIITCNPPYFKLSDSSQINLTDELAIARHEIKVNLESIFKISSEHLNDKGEFYLVHRVDRLDEIIINANKYNLNVKNIELIKTKEDNKPYIVLVRCIKNSKYGIKINNVINIDKLVTYKNLFKEE